MHKEVNAKKAEAERLLKRIQEMTNLHMQEKRELNDQLVTERRKLATLNQPLKSVTFRTKTPFFLPRTLLFQVSCIHINILRISK